MRRKADTGVSRSATISLHTGTNVPRRASSLNSSNDVIFIASKLRQPLERGVSHHAALRLHPDPPLKLFRGLSDQHVEATDGLAASGRRFAQQTGHRRVVDQVVHISPGQLRSRYRRLVHLWMHADRRAVDEEVPTARF